MFFLLDPEGPKPSACHQIVVFNNDVPSQFNMADPGRTSLVSREALPYHAAVMLM